MNMKDVLFTCAAYAAMAIAAFGADDAPIGVFDSGLGGLTVLERLLDVDQVDNATGLYGPDGVPDLAHERFTYLGDQANMPYGDYAAEGKSDYLRELILKDAKFLLSTNYYRCDKEVTPSGTKQRVKIIVIACNTATAWGLDDVRKYLDSIEDGTKVVGVIEAGVRATLDHVAAKAGSEPFALGVMATPGTIASGAYERTIRAELKARGVACEVPVINQGCAGLADAVESGSPTADSIARSNLVSLVERYRASGKTTPIRAVILGCTHYPFVLATLEKTVAELREKGAPFAEDFRFVDPAFYTAAECHRILRESGRLAGSKGPVQVDAFLSVANPALPPECLTPDGQLTRKFKYGRDVGSDAVTTKPVPLTRKRFGDDLFRNIGRLLPRTASLIDPAGNVVWQIGEKDGTGNEFALAPTGYEIFIESDFGWEDKFFLIGHSDAKKEFPYVLPGVNDKWTGSTWASGRHTQQVNVLFDLTKKGAGAPWTLFIDIADVHKAQQPLLKVVVNGKARKFVLPKGGGDASILKGDFSKAKPHTVKIDLSDAEIREGANEISITSLEGSWAIFDDVRLEGPADAVVRRAHKGAYVRDVKAGDYLIPGTGMQPLLVAVEHLDGTPTLRVEIDGKVALEEIVETGAYVFEAPMAVAAVSSKPPYRRAGYRVLVDGECVREGTVVRTPQRDAGVAGYVDTRMGTAHSRWMLAPGPWTPFSMVKLSPDNEGEQGKRRWQGGYDPTIESIGMFSHIHEWTMAGLGTMPVTGPLKTKMGGESEVAGHADGYRSYIDKASEVCKAGYYAVKLTDYDILAELTATDRCGFQRYTYPNGKTPRVMIDLLTPTEYNFSILASEIRQTGPRRVEGFSKQESPRVWSRDADQFYTIHFVIEFDHDIVNFNTWKTGAWAEFASETGGPCSVAAANTVVQMRSGISFVDLAGAANNLKREVEEPFGWSFEKVRAANEAAWNDLLGRVKIATADAREKKRFYTNLYRAFCRNTFNDVDGRWNDPFGKIQKLDDPDARAMGCDAFWNTFWNLNQEWSLVGPEWSARWVKSQMALYEAGGWLGKGPTGMRYVPVMVAEHEIPQMVSAWQMGIHAYDPKKQMAAFVKMQTTPAQKVGRGFAGNRSLAEYMQYHYVPSDKGKFSNSMEYSFDDWTVGQFAKAIGDEAAYKTFSERGTWWKNAVNPESGYCHRRNSEGEWEKDFDPFSGKGYTEGNAWQLTYFVPQDVPALVERIGRERFLERLTWGFEKSCPFRYNAPGENYAKYPVVQGNQQSMHFAFLFNWAKEPWNTQKWARSIMERYYGYGDSTAWLGDEDQGQMSAWFVMASLGLFQTDGGCRVDPVYEIASPLYKEAVVDLGRRYGRGQTFTIKAHNASRTNKYVQKAVFNGKPHGSFLLDAREVLKGGTLELWMGPEPNR